MGLSIAHHQAFATAATPDKTETDIKGMIGRWLLSHGQGGAIFFGFVLLVWAVLSQAQNIESTFRMLCPHFRRWFGSRKPEPEPLPPPSPLLTKLPAARKGFLARSAELQQLAAELAPEAARVVIHGMPGVGKTSLALHYAHSASSSHPGGAWWFSASEGFEPMVLEALSELEVRIPGLVRVEGLSLEARLRRCFEAWPGEEREAVLLVVDNLPSPAEGGVAMVERLTTGLPRRFRCLFTQRAFPTSTQAALKLPVLASEEALELLRLRSGESGRQCIAREEDKTRLLVEEVGRLPLALVLLGGRLERVPSLTVSALREDLADSALVAKAFSERNAAFLGEQGLVATLLSSWASLGAEAQELARLLSLTLAAPIPWELIERCVPSGPPTTPQTVNRYWEDALAELVSSNLLDALQPDRSLYGLHPLVREFFSSQRDGWEQERHWRGEMCRAAQDLASQWKMRDLLMAEEYWRQACQAQPTNIWAGYGLGLAMLHLGQLASAKKAFVKCWRNGVDSNDLRGVACACEGIGDVLRAQGDNAGALAAFQEGLNITEVLSKHDPANTLWKRDLSISHNRIGDVLVAQGDSAGALVEYNAAMTIREILVKIDSSNMEWQHDLAISYNRIGDVLVAQGDSAGAHGAYHAAMEIRGILAKIDPSNMEWQHDLSTGHERIGGLLEMHGDHSGALTEFKAALSIRENLARKNPLRRDWHRGISIIHERIGDVLGVVGDSHGALVAYKHALSIMEALVQRDPSNTEWQRDLSVSHNKMGDVLMSQGDGPGALVAYQAGLAIVEGLVTLDPANTQWQRDLSMSQEKIGDVLMSNEDGPGALAVYQAELTIREGLAKSDLANTQWQVDVAMLCGKLGTLEAVLPVPTRRTYLQRGLNITLTLKEAGRLHANQDYKALFEEEIRKLESSD